MLLAFGIRSTKVLLYLSENVTYVAAFSSWLREEKNIAHAKFLRRCVLLKIREIKSRVLESRSSSVR